MKARVALFLLALCATCAHARLVVMHGYAAYTSALVWVQADAPGPIRFRWLTEHDGVEHETIIDARAADDDVVLARLTGLAPGARAAYTIEGDGDVKSGTVRALEMTSCGEPCSCDCGSFGEPSFQQQAVIG